MNDVLFVSVAEAARRCAISRSDFYKRVARGEFRIHKVGTRSLVSVADLQRWHDAIIAKAG